MSRPDPIVDLLLNADLPGLHDRARARAREHARAGEPLLERAWADLAAACRELMPTMAGGAGGAGGMSRVKSSTAGSVP